MTSEQRFHDDATGMTLVLAEAAGSPALWKAFLDGARARYRLHGAEQMVAAKPSAIARGIERFSAVFQGARLVAGLRVRGPLTADDLPICRELDGFPASEIIHHKIRDRLGEGLLEGKTAWVEKGFKGDGAALTRLLVAGAYLHLPPTGSRWIVGTVSPIAVPMFTAGGGVMDDDIDPVPFPTPDMLTGVVWFDRAALEDRIAGFGAPDVVQRVGGAP